MDAYLKIVEKVLREGLRKENRTGVPALTAPGIIFEHDLSAGFPLLTTKKVPFRLIASELEFFIKGITDKQWLQERNNHVWDEWCSPRKVPYAHDAETKRQMREERDLGPIYGFQWRHFNAPYQGYDQDYSGLGVDQLKLLVEGLKKNPHDRRLIVSAWNPQQAAEMALPPCHYQFQVTVIDGTLHLMWSQRSVDTMLGLPFNIASYALLLHLLAKETGLREGKLTGFLSDVHIYENHAEKAREQLSRKPHPLPQIVTKNFTSIFDWQYTQTEVMDYQSHPRIDFEIAV